ncbi:MAG: CCDC90 family protein [Magnetococcus sp. DMHC-1]
MTTITYDTLKFVRRLKDAGIPENHAEAISEAFKDAQTSQMEDLVTKKDLLKLDGQVSCKADVAKVDFRIQELNTKIETLNANIETTRMDLRRDIETAKLEVIKWLVGASGAIVALVKLLPGGH